MFSSVWFKEIEVLTFRGWSINLWEYLSQNVPLLLSRVQNLSPCPSHISVFGECRINQTSNLCFNQVWKNYVCKVSASDICTTTGRLTPTYYDQMAAAVNVSYGLYRYTHFLVDLEDCTFVRTTFTDINRDHCPGLRKYSEWIYVGLVLVSAAVMFSLIFWVIYARERRHRVYTKSRDSRAMGFDGKAT